MVAKNLRHQNIGLPYEFFRDVILVVGSASTIPYSLLPLFTKTLKFWHYETKAKY